MRLKRETVQSGSFWWSGFAALLLHVALVCGLPREAHEAETTRPVPELAWMSVVETAAPAAPPARDEAQATVTPKARARARKVAEHAEQSAHVPEALPSDGELAVPPAGSPDDQAVAAAETAEGGSTKGARLAGGASEAQGAGNALSPPVRGPGLLARSNPCAGFFPANASADEGQVHIHVEVDADGRARTSDLLVEFPAGQGFGHAARACASALRFSPAVDQRGVPVAGRAKLALRFRRS